jgi:hypothetical protein
MTRRRFPALLAAISCVALLAGCGSSSSSSSSTAATTTAASTASSTSVPSSTPSVPSGGASSAQIQAAVEECKTIIASESKLPHGAKEKLEGACSKAAKGDTTAVKQAAREVCEEVINASPLPAAAKQQALPNCKK